VTWADSEISLFLLLAFLIKNLEGDELLWFFFCCTPWLLFVPTAVFTLFFDWELWIKTPDSLPESLFVSLFDNPDVVGLSWCLASVYSLLEAMIDFLHAISEFFLAYLKPPALSPRQISLYESSKSLSEYRRRDWHILFPTSINYLVPKCIP
jgi:hypothetical protein